MTDTLLYRKNMNENEIKQKIEKKKEKQKFYYDRSAKLLPTLNVGDTVIFKKKSKEWNYGTIVGTVNGKSYIVRDSFNYHFRRNRRFIAKSMNTGFNTSDLLFEESLIRNENEGDDREEIQIVVPRQNVIGNPSPVIPVVGPSVDLDNMSDHYDTAESDTSETDGVLDGALASPVQTEVLASPTQSRTTRSGRVSRPPQRYGW